MRCADVVAIDLPTQYSPRRKAGVFSWLATGTIPHLHRGWAGYCFPFQSVNVKQIFPKVVPKQEPKGLGDHGTEETPSLTKAVEVKLWQVQLLG